MLSNFQFGTQRRLVAAEATVISSANCAVIGVLFNSTSSGAITIYHGVTAVSTVTRLRGFGTASGATVNTAVYYPAPVYCSGGMTVVTQGTNDPDITLFWNPI